MAKRELPEINAGSMADIAFLLLIFFLVTTTMDVDSGISRKLPEKQPENMPEPPKIKQKNILEINLNRNNEMLVEDELMEIKDLKEYTIEFLDNGGGVGKPTEYGPGAPCDYCNGKKADDSSDHPNKAVISVQSDRGTSYGMYITVQNELLAAYTELRNRYAKKYVKGRYAGMSYDDLLLLDGNDKENENEELKAVIKQVKNAYPQIISDAEPTK